MNPTRDCVRELRSICHAGLEEKPLNWRRHRRIQRKALEVGIGKIGVAELPVRECVEATIPR